MTTRPIPVALFTNSRVRGGAEQHMLTLLRAIDRRRFRPFLVCPTELVERMSPDVPGDVGTLPLLLNHPTQVSAMLWLARFLREQKIGVLHSHLFFSSLFASPVGRAAGVPVIVETPHLAEVWRKGWKASFAVDRFVGRCVDRYIAVSEANARYLVQVKRLPADKVQVVQNGCDLRRFALPHRAENLRSSLGFNAQDRLLVVIGRLEQQKGHAILLKALSLVRLEFHRARLICVGEGALLNELEERTSALGLRDSVRFVGYQENVPEWLSVADVVVLPSLFEGLPLVAIEALAARKPMVATAVDGTPEVVIDGRTGLTVPPNDAPALAAALGRVLRDPSLATKLAAQGHAWVGERFSEDRQVRETEDLYLRLWATKHADSECAFEMAAGKANQ